MRRALLIPLGLLLAVPAAAQQTAIPNFGTLADPPVASLDQGARMPLPVEPQFAEPGTRSFAAMIADLRTEPGPNLMVFHTGNEKQPLPEEPKPR